MKRWGDFKIMPNNLLFVRTIYRIKITGTYWVDDDVDG